MDSSTLRLDLLSEYETTYRLGRPFRRGVLGYIERCHLEDGGYGAKGQSTLASTFYATEIHKLLGVDTGKLIATRNYLKRREEKWQVQFIEDVYWLVLGLASLDEKTNMPDRVARFVMGCQRQNGGFSRATVMGIPTLEYTFYALSILKRVGAL